MEDDKEMALFCVEKDEFWGLTPFGGHFRLELFVDLGFWFCFGYVRCVVGRSTCDWTGATGSCESFYSWVDIIHTISLRWICDFMSEQSVLFFNGAKIILSLWKILTFCQFLNQQHLMFLLPVVSPLCLWALVFLNGSLSLATSRTWKDLRCC